MAVITRFAPSPTGRLHVGNVRTALHNWLLAAKALAGGDQGFMQLRIDDTDIARSREEYVDAIYRDLEWLGLDFASVRRQSEYAEQYEEWFDVLRREGRIYPCYETAQELDLKRKVLLGRGLPPIYDRAALELSDAHRAANESEGIAPHWRFKLDHETAIEWHDGIRGPQHFDPKQLSDPVIRRADGSWLYMFPSVVDDEMMGITHVLRGEDHVSNTAVQIQIYNALESPIPQFAHEALMVGTEGKLSKRLGSLGCDALRESGIEPEAVVALLARLGTSQPVEPIAERAALIESFDLASFGRAPARFDEAELARLNAAIVHQLPFAHVASRLPDGMTEAGWEAIRPNLEKVVDAADLWRVVTGPIEAPGFDDETRAYLAEAARLLAWSDDPWGALTGALKEATGRKGKALFLPLRQALTGADHGPDMHALLPLIGEAEARRRLEAAASV